MTEAADSSKDEATQPESDISNIDNEDCPSSEACASDKDESVENEEVPQEAEDSEAEKKITELETQVEQLQGELKEAQQDLGYARAETQTTIRRGREDLARAINRTKRELINRLIKVADTFHHTSNELANVERNEDTEVIVTAVEMAIKDFDKTLNGEGVEILDPKGEVFDPQLHEAQVSVPTADAEPNTVLEVLRIGYQLDGTLLRAPQVIVATALPDDEKDSGEGESEDE